MINFPLPVVAIFSALLNLVFWSMSGSLGTRFEAKLCACLGKHGYQLRQPEGQKKKHTPCTVFRGF
ncbi:hypothetical protein ERO13_1Z049333v2 [Gossypium hirsutum]|nr:hypothetical protein ERO13_1Z049333v2 [Gossypium hirsutum]